MLPARPSASRPDARVRATAAAAGLVAATLVAVAGCGDATTGPLRSTARSATLAATAPSASPAGEVGPGPTAAAPIAHGDESSATGMAGMAGGGAAAADQLDLTGDGLSAESDGLRLVVAPTTLTANRPSAAHLQVRGDDNQPITRFVTVQDEPMHLYLIRSDLTGFQHLHPTMAADGTWTVGLPATPAGFYRAYASFTTTVQGRDTPMVLSQPITVPGAAAAVPLPAPSTTTTADGYTLTVATPRGPLAAGTASPFTVTVTRGGRLVTDLRPYLSSLAHVSAFHERDLAFAHLHPADATTTGAGGPTLTFTADLPRPGAWRAFVQFRTDTGLHTAAITLTARGAARLSG
ncbi:hypothetical protein [Frankia sp. AgB32]|uniref:hypothetical protein n=1 Tax=Frankia sp. AgB32 TaxID=631119 RepID=UPI00200D513D|nr:hypothetical protein [Frankia sp. AgB32]MCK9893969.1 hypothetical protein [Frankia sp. AgB32]